MGVRLYPLTASGEPTVEEIAAILSIEHEREVTAAQVEAYRKHQESYPTFLTHSDHEERYIAQGEHYHQSLDLPNGRIIGDFEVFGFGKCPKAITYLSERAYGQFEYAGRNCHKEDVDAALRMIYGEDQAADLSKIITGLKWG